LHLLNSEVTRMNRYSRPFLASTAILALSAVFFSQAHISRGDETSGGSAAPLVAIRDEAFQPATITVKAGTTVSWVNKDDDPHTVTSDTPSFDSSGLDLDAKFSHTFRTPGRYAYHCAVHPFMRGIVIVKENR